MAYRPGTMFQWDGEMFDYLIVSDDDEAEIAQADGWVFHKPTPEEEVVAVAKKTAKKAAPAQDPTEGTE